MTLSQSIVGSNFQANGYAISRTLLIAIAQNGFDGLFTGLQKNLERQAKHFNRGDHTLSWGAQNQPFVGALKTGQF